MPAPEEIAKDKLDRIRNNKALYCKICGISKKDKKKVVHCEDCDVCVEEYDHHCPWTGKCIGKGNIWAFYMFVATTLILFAYIIFAATLSVYAYSLLIIYDIGHNWKHADEENKADYFYLYSNFK